MYNTFQAQTLTQSEGETTISAFGDDMAVQMENGVVVITKEQAMEFFRLEEIPPLAPEPVSVDILKQIAELRLGSAIERDDHSDTGVKYYWTVMHFLAHNANSLYLEDKWRTKALDSMNIT